MIITWTKDCVKVIPVTQGAGKKPIIVDRVTLLPGNNEVDKDVWESVRGMVEDQIKTGVIKEVHVETAAADKKSKAPIGKITKWKEFAELDVADACEVAENTYDLKTLKKWKKKEGRDAVRATIMQQIEKVETHGSDGAKKKGSDKDDEE